MTLVPGTKLGPKVVCIMRRQKDLTRREILMGVASTIAGNLFAHQQQAERDESPTFSVNVDVVNVFVTVRDKKGSQYNLGYVPDAKARSGYRKIKVGVQKKGLVVHGRPGYFSNISKTKAAGRSR